MAVTLLILNLHSYIQLSLHDETYRDYGSKKKFFSFINYTGTLILRTTTVDIFSGIYLSRTMMTSLPILPMGRV